ncbi:LysR substrate-binding domain-containing protein [Horticoccus sp. 23ND18S-11]|uniref:LysR substrate-binding domain-containing protein n=1 Tax=Horticoccus sp. 23ND18S-11 TaxID=3391832 RepID=UPI0039C8FD29
MNLELIRSFFSIAEQGSLNKAAERMRVSQSTLTRQMQTLEHEIGGRLLERGAGGVALTAAGHVLADGMRPVLGSFDRVIDATRKLACGKTSLLRVGYLMSAAADYLHPALAALRKAHPEVKVTLLDMSPGEQIRALRKGELDIALIGHAGTFLAREFFVRRLASLPVVVALSAHHALGAAPAVRLRDLKGEMFVGAPDSDMPGHNQWIRHLCRRAGFRPRFVQDADSLAHGLSTIVTEDAIGLMPAYATRHPVPGVVFRPLQDASAKWDLVVAWQRGKSSPPLRVMLDELGKTPA